MTAPRPDFPEKLPADLPPGDPLHRLLVEDRPWVVSIARALVLDDARAEDLAQEAFIAALRSPPDNPGALRAWLRTAMRNIARQTARGEIRRRGREQRVARPEPTDDDPSEAIARLEIRQQVIAALLALDEPHRTAVVLRHLEGRPVAEIARRTDANESTVRSRIQRGLERLRAHLDRVHGGDRDRWSLGLVLAAAWAVAAEDAGAVEGETVDAETASSGGGVIPAPGSSSPLAWAGAIAATVTIGIGVWMLLSGIESGPPAPEQHAEVRPDGGDMDFVAPEMAGGTQPPPPTDENIALAEEPAETVAVTVVDADGNPVAGAEVSWWGTDLAVDGRAGGRDAETDRMWRTLPERPGGVLTSTTIRAFAPQVTTDARGIARVPPPPAGESRVLVAVGEAGSARSVWRSGEEPAPLALVASPRLTVVEADGSPAPYAWIELEHSNLRSTFLLAVTDEQGQVDLAEVIDRWGDEHRWLAGAGFPVVEVASVVIDPRAREAGILELPPTGSLSVRVSESLRSALAGHDRLPITLITRPLEEWRAGEFGITDRARQRWSFPQSGGRVVEIPRIGVGLGLHFARDPGGFPQAEIGPRAGEQRTVEIVPDPQVVFVRIPVLDEDGRPLTEGGWKSALRSEERGLHPSQGGQFDEEGLALVSIRRDESNPREVILYRNPRRGRDDLSQVISIPVPPPGSPRVIELPPTGFEPAPLLLAGEVLDPAGHPVADLPLQVSSLIRSSDLEWPPFATELRGRTDAHGRFEIRGIPFEGKVELGIEQRSERLEPRQVTIGATDLRLVRGAETPLTVTGRVRVPPGFEHAVAFRWMGTVDRHRRGVGAGIWDAATGAFSFPAGPGGDTLHVQVAGYDSLELPLVAEGGATRIEVGVIDLRAVIAEQFLTQRFSVVDPHGGMNDRTEWRVGLRRGDRWQTRHRVRASGGILTLFLHREVEEVLLHSRGGYARFDPRRASRLEIRPAPVVLLTVSNASDPRFERGLRCGVRSDAPFHDSVIRVQTEGREVPHSGEVTVVVPFPGKYDLEWQLRDGSVWRGHRLERTRIVVSEAAESSIEVEVRWRD